MSGDSVECGRARVFGPMFFSFFDLFPIGPNFVDVFDFRCSEYVRMAADQFVNEVTRYFSNQTRHVSLKTELAVNGKPIMQQRHRQVLQPFRDRPPRQYVEEVRRLLSISSNESILCVCP